ncbi:hypothetical protein LAZ67_1006346 [Cordylochernes scorpioides]|uniref:HTH CENPB-type domain-containing protein n=1 Tax=Cordylochernes scorpioides TaxID=51811 RepID=A0ABY6K273_9ARAC|nr:hypothetical protein LAZ67_1006346 [Cordylochernes scorpioides]
MWTAEWNEIVFTYESRFCLKHHDRRIRVWRHREERMLNICIMHRHTGSAPGIMYGRSTSMICSVLKRKESIKSVTPAKGLTIISKLRTSLHENMEKLLMVWVTEKQHQGDTLTQTIICEKARAIYGDLLKQTPQTSIDEASEESFKASRGWFENFKKRSGIHSVVRHGEAASSDIKAAGKKQTSLDMFFF